MWLNPLETADLVTFTEEILNKKPIFLCSDTSIVELLLAKELEPTFYISDLSHLAHCCLSNYIWSTAVWVIS